MRILITGSSGFVGHNLIAELRAEHELFAAYLRHRPQSGATELRFDIAERDAVERAFDSARPEMVIHAAAMSKPDACEREPEEAYRVIAGGTRRVVAAARARGARTVVLSTDLVFDGARGRYAEDDTVGTESVYGRAKIQAEGEASALDPTCVILRVALMYGRGNEHASCFLDTTLERWRAGVPVRFYTDQFRTPLLVTELAEAIRRLAARPRVAGILHLGGADRLSRYDFARTVAELVGADAGLVRPGSMLEGGPAPRGADCSLVCGRIRAELDLEPITCRRGLERLASRGQLEKLRTAPSA